MPFVLADETLDGKESFGKFLGNPWFLIFGGFDELMRSV